MRFGLQNTFEWVVTRMVATLITSTSTICIAKLAVATTLLAAEQVTSATAASFSSFVIKWVLLNASSQYKVSSYVATYVHSGWENNASIERSLSQWASTKWSLNQWGFARQEGKKQTFGLAATRKIWRPLSHRSDAVVWVTDCQRLMLVEMP